MTKICYVPKRFNRSSQEVIDRTNQIIAEYRAQGYDLTLRQIYYQHVSRGYIDNNDREYKRLGAIINDARLAGLIDWEAVVDRTRNLRTNPHWSTPADIMKAAAQSYAIDRWADQPHRVFCLFEKDALLGVFERICQELDVPYFSCRGYVSQSEMWAMGQRLRQVERKGQVPVLLHFGDHDPSGIDMTRDITDRLALFMGGVEVERLALNWEQIEEHNPPANPAKLSDARAATYVAEYGDESWELDALRPDVLAGLVRDAVDKYLDHDVWTASTERQEEEREHLKLASKHWTKLVPVLDEIGHVDFHGLNIPTEPEDDGEEV